MARRLVNICACSEIPRLNEMIVERTQNLPAVISCLDPQTITGNEPELQQAEVIVTEPHYAPNWLYGLTNLKLVLGTWAGVDR